MSDLVLHEKWELTPTGLNLRDPDMPLEDFTHMCFVLGKLHAAVRFAMGDAIILGEQIYGEASHQSFEAFNLSEAGRLEYVRVSLRVPKARRRRDLSWSHHRAVAALDPPAQKDWLKRASSEGMSHADLRAAMRNGVEPEAVQVCPACGKKL